jgi:excinuclease ABC subunit C
MITRVWRSFRGTPDKKHRTFGPFPPTHWRCAKASRSCRRCSACAPARTVCSATAPGLVCCIRSSLQRALRWPGQRCRLRARCDHGGDVSERQGQRGHREISARMQAASEALRFEQAAVYRDQIQALSAVRARQFVESRSTQDADIIAGGDARAASPASISAWCAAAAVWADARSFPSHVEDADLPAVLEAFVGQHYIGQPVPATLVLECEVAKVWPTGCRNRPGRRVQIVTHPQEERRIWLEMARKNAELALATREGLRENQSQRLAALNEALGEEGIARIECFDVSHTMGEATVVSCVVFDNGAMQSSEYRRYNVTGITPGRRLCRDARGDFPALRQAGGRRRQTARPAADRRRQGAVARGGGCAVRTGPGRSAHGGCGQGRGTQAGHGTVVLSRRGGTAAAAVGSSRHCI